MDDIPSPRNCLHGAFIYSTEPLAQVKGINFKPVSSLDGVTTLISFKDIPGENVGAQTIFGTEPLYADELTQCAGQPIALVVIPWFPFVALPHLAFVFIFYNLH